MTKHGVAPGNRAATWAMAVTAYFAAVYLVAIAPPNGTGPVNFAAAAWLVVSPTILVVRQLTAAVLRPLIGYTSEWVAVPSTSLTRGAARYRQVRLRNAGLAPGIVVDVRWRIAGRRVPTAVTMRLLDLPSLHAQLRTLGLVDGSDYTVGNLTPGAPLASDAEARLLFEGTAAMLDEVQRLEAVIKVAGLLGGRYTKTVSLLPHPGASTATAPSASPATAPTGATP